MINGVNSNRNSSILWCTQRDFFDQMGVLYFTAHWCAVFAIECDIKDTGAKLLRHLGL